jgi:ribosomal protein S18 acetylase RimI-like enzyme
MSIQIQLGIKQNQKISIAKIFYESFIEKLYRLFGDPQKAIKLFSKLLREDQILVAIKDNNLVGFVGLHYNKKHFIKFNFTEISRIYGIKAILATLYFLTNIFDTNQQKQLHLEVIAVDKKQRTKGVGTRLLLSTIEFAKLKGFNQIRLEVINTNPKAKKLYEKTGFKKIKDRKIPYPFHIFASFNKITEMHYKLKE